MSDARSAAAASTKADVREFWNANSCGKKFVEAEVGSKEFFDGLEEHRYRLEPHILEVVPFASAKGEKVLEVGCGLGTDAVRWARAGADYQGIDLTPAAVELTRRRFALEGLPGRVDVVDAEAMPFPDDAFDLVYSHGVIHHTPNIEKAVSEIHRVLKPGGRAIVMVYHRRSANYYLNILLLRRVGLLALFLPGGVWLAHKLTGESIGGLRAHRDDFRRMGWRYLSSSTFLSRNTDGAGNPLSRVYSSEELKRLFGVFSSKTTVVRYLNTHRLPLLGRLLPRSVERALAARFGWHIYLFAEK